MKCLVSIIENMDYQRALELQNSLVAMRRESQIPDVLLLLEHQNVYTVGKHFNAGNLLIDKQTMLELGIDVASTDRGGEITYHGPGQLVGYPIMTVCGIQRIRQHLAKIEETVIRTARDFGIVAARLDGFPGVWVGFKKLAAVGLRITRGISKHGFALNVSTDLAFFDGIVPCGIPGSGATSLSEILNTAVPLEAARESVIGNFASVFDTDMIAIQYEKLLELCDHNIRKVEV